MFEQVETGHNVHARGRDRQLFGQRRGEVGASLFETAQRIQTDIQAKRLEALSPYLVDEVAVRAAHI